MTIRGEVVEVGELPARNGNEPLAYVVLQQPGQNGRSGHYPQLMGETCRGLKKGDRVTFDGTVVKTKTGFWVADLVRVADQQPVLAGAKAS